jgi:adenylate cyclase
MADLIAQGSDPQQRWRRTLSRGKPTILGRSGQGWTAPWDDRISRQHAQIVWDGERLDVQRLPKARNAIFYKGRQHSQFQLLPGEHFVIGGTTFTLADERVNISVDAPQPVQQQTYTSQYLQKIQFRHAEAHIDVLSRMPEVISGATSDQELYVRLVNLLLAGVSRASAAALVAVKPVTSNAAEAEDRIAERPTIKVLHWDRRRISSDDFQPSEKLILQAIERRESVLHIWDAAEVNASPLYTASQGVDWAYCTPIGGQACDGWAIYVAGRFTGDSSNLPTYSDPSDLRDDLKFTELAAGTVSALRDVQVLTRQRAGLSQFFSPVVLDALSGEDPELVLAPRETEVSVLFCDLRGFSRHVERSADNLMHLLHRVSNALGVTTHEIREQGGVLGDFHGDAAMGFWGWPIPQPDGPLRACLAALAIRAQFAEAAKQAGHPLADFRVGIGIATGRAVAGKIGTADQVKVTVFGPVVNLAARMEGMTKSLQSPILIDEKTAAAVRQLKPNGVRLRRVAHVKPYGLDKPLQVTELLPDAKTYPELTDQNIADYEQALDEVIAGRWWQAFDRLHRVPAEDRVKDFLTVFIAQHNRTPPDDWQGVIPLTSK